MTLITFFLPFLMLALPRRTSFLTTIYFCINVSFESHMFHLNTEILYQINTVLCPIKVNSNAIKLSVHTSCYCINKSYYSLQIIWKFWGLSPQCWGVGDEVERHFNFMRCPRPTDIKTQYCQNLKSYHYACTPTAVGRRRLSRAWSCRYSRPGW